MNHFRENRIWGCRDETVFTGETDFLARLFIVDRTFRLNTLAPKSLTLTIIVISINLSASNSQFVELYTFPYSGNDVSCCESKLNSTNQNRRVYWCDSVLLHHDPIKGCKSYIWNIIDDAWRTNYCSFWSRWAVELSTPKQPLLLHNSSLDVWNEESYCPSTPTRYTWTMEMRRNHMSTLSTDTDRRLSARAGNVWMKSSVRRTPSLWTRVAG